MPISSGEHPGRPTPILSVDGLSGGYGGPPIVRDVSLAVGKGEVVTVVGPNGAGKSTLLKTIVGIVKSVKGRVQLKEQVLTGWPTERLARAGIGYVPQSAEVFGDLTVLENLRLGGYLCSRREVRSRIDEILEIFPHLEEMMDRHANKVSGGERKMVAIGRALMSKPEVLLLDEPTAGLSPELSTFVLESQLAALANAGCAVLMVEQKALAALKSSDWGYVLVAGSVFLSSPAPALLARPDLSAVFLGEAAPRDELAT